MAKNTKKKKVKVEDHVDEVEVVSKVVEENENKTLLWFFAIVVLIFSAVLVPYFWTESNKIFEFGGINWVVEDYQDLKIFHGRFVSLTNPNLNYNIFLRNDPRKNDVKVVGKLDDFKYGGIISLSPEVDACRGDLSRVMLDLGSYLKQGVGVGPLAGASSSEATANESGRDFVDCETVGRGTVVLIEIGDDVGIVQDEENPYCYVITARNCEDSRTVEKFMIDAVEDFRNRLE